MLNAHSLIAITREQHWLPAWFEQRKGVTHEGLVTPKLLSELLEYEKFLRMGINREELERLTRSNKPVPYSSFVTGIFDLYGEKRGKPLVGDKTPAYVRSISSLHALWPEAKFVHIIRDGRDVCLSTIAWARASRFNRRFTTWSEDTLTTASLWWEWNVRLGREAGSSLAPELYQEIRYESLVSTPAEECVALCAYLGIPYDGVMLEFHEGREKTDPSLDAKKAWRPVTAGLRDWRSQMPREDLERFEAAAGALLDELGYERVFPQPKPEALRHASKIRDSFTRDIRSEGRVLPERW
jgi:hypothetical protein